MKFVKSLENMLKSQTFFIILAVIVLIIGLNYYSKNKSSLLSGFTQLNPENVNPTMKSEHVSNVEGASASPDVGSPISGIEGPSVNSSNSVQKQISNPADLLPKDTNSEWAQLNPNGAGDLQNISLLKAGHHTGINTVGSSLKNANLQVRSEPVIPKSSVGPWLNSSIEPDCIRPKLEIGGPSC